MFSIARALRCCHQSHIANRLVRPAGIGGLGLPGSGPKSHDVLIRGKKSKAKRKEAAVEENEYDGVDLAVLEADMTKVSQAFKTSLSRLRAVGAHPEMLDGTPTFFFPMHIFLFF